MKQKSLFSSELNIDKSKEELFGAPDLQLASSYTLGGNFHQLSDQKINKLISLKFNGNPISLIRQLSNDLAVKESEQILLRKENFLREQELIKLCNEYGNLSRLEIDSKLKNLKLYESVDNTLSELIRDAINDDIYESNSSVSNSETLSNMKSNTNNLSSNIEHDKKYEVEELFKDKYLTIKDNKSNGWLSYWFNSTDDLVSDSQKSSFRLEARSFSNILTSIPHLSKNMNSTYNNRVPLELKSIVNNDYEYKFNNSDAVSIDKYGFLNDVNTSGSKNPIEDINREKSTPIIKSNNTDPVHGVTISNLSITNHVFDLDISGTGSTSSNNHTVDLLREIGKLHDAKNKELEHHWDIFFREILRDIYKKDIDNEHIKQNSLSATAMSDIQISNTSISGILSKRSKHYKTLRNLINSSGIPSKYRYSLWLELSGATNLKINGEFERLYQTASQADDKVVSSHLRQINLDIHRTMPSNIYFHDVVNAQPGPHLKKLKKILYAFATYKNDIGYSQGMNKIVGNLLLGDNRISDEDIFWIFIGLVENILPHYDDTISYFDARSLIFIKTDQIIMKEVFFPRLMPKLASHFQKLNIQIEFITINWWLSLFTDNFLNIDIWFKIFDTLLISDVELKLMSLSLATFKALEKFLMSINDKNGIYLAMKDLKHSSSTKINLKYSELMEISNQMEKKINKEELHDLRRMFSTE